MRRGAALLLLALFSISGAQPAKDSVPEPLPRVAPRTPEESLKAFEVHPQFRVELAAAEPLVQSPVAAEFDEDGRLFVVELPEYNQYGSAKPHGQGRVVMLEDTDGDGKFDKRTVVVDGLDYPTALFPWDGGLYVGAAPDLLYFKNGKRTVVLTGFGKDKAGEGQLNSFRWTLENRILISTGLDGGAITRPGSTDKPVNVKSLNILLDPRTNTFETTSGGGQHGLTLDDWGNTFVCGNSDPCLHLVYDTRYLAKNPLVIAPPPAVNIAPGGKYTKLHRISAVEPWRALRTRLRKEGAVPGSDEGGTPSGFFTGATGITVYRGDAYPEEFRGNAFVGEVANNLVFRAKLVPKGVSFVAERADEGREFLASKDVWFRPVQFFHGPDGCLYVIDMYRELIEGAAFLAPPILKQVDPSAGVDKGRLWRIVPAKPLAASRKPPRLSIATTAELVKLLEHPDGWHRETAARLLYQRQDKQAVPLLEKLVRESKSPVGRLQGLYALTGLVPLRRETGVELDKIIRSLIKNEGDPRMRVHAVRLARTSSWELGEEELLFPIIGKLDDNDLRVRFQALWTLCKASYLPSEISIFQQIARQDGADTWMRLAFITAHSRDARLIKKLIEDAGFRKLAHAPSILGQIVEVLGAQKDGNYIPAVTDSIQELPPQETILALHLLRHLTKRASLETQRQLLDGSFASKNYFRVIERVRKLALDEKQESAHRAEAISSLELITFQDLADLLKATLKPDQPQPVQTAALELLGKTGDDRVPGVILAAWPGMSPQVRATAAEVFLSRPKWVAAFLDAVEQKKVARGDVDPARVALLLKSPNRAVRVRAEQLFQGAGPGARKEVIEKYQKALTLKGDAAKGKLVFKTNCSACHKLDGVGEEVGADLRAIRDRGLEGVLLAVLDPNREVKPQYLAYTLETLAGKTLAGMVTAETPNSVTIRRLDGTSETIPRADIDKLRSTGLSFMPEGLEKQIDVAAMADLLAYLNSIK
jgi:putative membrane-bound dehydrogenase-like protein